VGMISHLGPQFGVADGIALGNKLKKNNKVCAVFTGDGGTSEGDIHEALNVASVWQLPVLFCIENNGYGLSTPSSQQFNCEHLSDRAQGYGMESHIIDGNNILEVYTKLQKIVADVREHPRPVLIEFMTFRVRGHEEASGTKYVPKELLHSWHLKDPLENYTVFLRDENILTDEIEAACKQSIMKEINDGLEIASAEPPIESSVSKELSDDENILTDEIEAACKQSIMKEINDGLEIASEEPPIESSVSKELSDVFQEFKYKEVKENDNRENIRLIDAISEGLKQSMQRHDNLILMGQDIAEYGGVFKVTDGFFEEFGEARVRNTPICESAIVSAAMGLSINGYKSMMEMQFSDFATSGFNPIVNLLAKSNYRWNQKADVVIRMPCGAGVGAGPFHSQTNEAWFTHTPGLKVVYPAFPYDAKGLLTTAIEDPNPVLFFEHKALYRSIRQEVPTDYYTLPLGKASLLKEGNDITIITYGAGVHWALETLETLPDVSADLLDLRTLAPLDTEAIYTSAKKTGKVIILQEDSMFGGIASDISAMIMENCFEKLDAPVKRVASLDTPIPFAANLESNYLPKNTFKTDLLDLIAY